ncbi:MAG: protein-L-isoaspartate(D-aspartate) O-methyltransferase [Dictyoglomus sp.]|nr:protein-L-isoaspartate(D-aspartate) O-methyltransferase [Dictyoglomus sp.]MCX7942537.1 protein-L-isoaspartate(D-aspartate) O-methyltransferase [Dictyoglomaceae bacterium]MDW8188775.1 protein-L-isoaspartate(D-aspartate) O-methyltransferase [Dictyoglomus sp.]
MEKELFDNWEHKKKRQELIDILREEGITSQSVLRVLGKIPRHLFIPKELEEVAYENQALPIGEFQTISQPFIVALMTQALELSGKEKVLEIGTGSGYQTAILAELSKEVFTIERIESLLEKAKKILEFLGYGNINFKLGDGTEGWEEFAPYDRIIVTASAPEIPFPLWEQLKENGIIVIPIGSREYQNLYKIIKRKDKKIVENLGGVVFVPLIGKYGWKE